MAALLGGTATYSAVEPGINNTVFNENPDDPAAEQRRFNFFDYAADGQLNGSVTISEFKMLGRILLPSPDAYDVTDRQRASANGFLLNPTAKRDFVALQRTLPQYQWVPPSAIKKYRNVSPAQFGVSKGIPPGQTFPLYTLFSPVISSNSTPVTTTVAATKKAVVNGQNIQVDYLSAVPSTDTTGTSSTGTTTTASTATTTSTTGTTTPMATSTTTAGTTTASTTAANSAAAVTYSAPASTPSAAQSILNAVDQAIQNSSSANMQSATSGSSSSSSTGGTSTPTTSGGTP